MTRLYSHAFHYAVLGYGPSTSFWGWSSHVKISEKIKLQDLEKDKKLFVNGWPWRWSSSLRNCLLLQQCQFKSCWLKNVLYKKTKKRKRLTYLKSLWACFVEYRIQWQGKAFWDTKVSPDHNCRNKLSGTRFSHKLFQNWAKKQFSGTNNLVFNDSSFPTHPVIPLIGLTTQGPHALFNWNW